MTRVNVRPDGTQAQWGASFPTISADGRFVAFISASPDLVAGDTNESDDVFVRDLATGVTTLVSVATGGAQGSGADARNVALSADGRVVAFDSISPDLVAGDTNSARDVFVRDRATGVTTRVSVATGGAQGNADSGLADLSADGRYVAFGSGNVLPDSTSSGVFVHDRLTSITTFIANGYQAALSADGRFVTFTSPATDIVPGDTNGFPDVFLHDRLTGTTRRVNVSTGGEQANYYSNVGDVSADGRVVVYTSAAFYLAYADGNNTWDVFAYDTLTGVNTLVSVGPGGVNGNHLSGGIGYSRPRISADGRYVVFESTASNLVAGDTNGVKDVFMHDRRTGITSRVSVGDAGVEATSWGRDADLSADGTRVVFQGPRYDIFVHDLDADRDGLLATWETAFGLDPLTAGGDHGQAGDPDGDGQTNAQEQAAGTHPRGLHTRYLAEGATSHAFFDTRIALLNPGASPARVLLTFQESDGSKTVLPVPVAARTRTTFDVKTMARLPEVEFSTVIESDVEVVVERLMQWDLTGYGSHAETAVAAPGRTWYLAEGATHSQFNLFYLVQNPNASSVPVTVTYLRPPPAQPLTKTYEVAGGARFNIWVNAEAATDARLAGLASADISAVLTAPEPFLVERAMYLNLPGPDGRRGTADDVVFGAGHESFGVRAPAQEWFLAEGATGPYFDLFVLIANPDTVDAQLEVSYLLPDGTVIRKMHTAAASSRYGIWVDQEDPRLADTAVSTTVRSVTGVPVIVERAMWWPGSSAQWYEAHNSAGATTTGTRWALAEGEVDAARGVETYILVANTSDTPADVKVTLLFEDGTSAERTYAAIPARSRFNVPVAAFYPEAAGRRFGALIESVGASPAALVVERAMYRDTPGQRWAAGSNALATRLP